MREVAQGIGQGPSDEGKVGETDPLLLAEAVLVCPADPLDPFVVGLDHREGVSRRRLGPDHVLGSYSPDVRERHDLVTCPRDGLVRTGGRRDRRRSLRSRHRLGPSLGGRLTHRRFASGHAIVDESEHVHAGDPAALAGPRYRSRVDAVLGDELTYDGRQHQPRPIRALIGPALAFFRRCGPWLRLCA